MSTTTSTLQQDLRASRWLLNLCPEIVTVSLFRTGAGFRELVEANDRAIHFFGYPREDFFDLPAKEVLLGEKQGKLRCVERRLAEEQHLMFETIVLKKDGRGVLMETEACLLHCDNSDFVVCFSTDISNRTYEKANKSRVLEELERSLGDCTIGYEALLANNYMTGYQDCMCRYACFPCKYQLKRISDQVHGTSLTLREAEVLTWISMGKNTSDIAVLLHIKESTVRYHVNRILEKLNALSRAHAVAIALQRGMI